MKNILLVLSLMLSIHVCGQTFNVKGVVTDQNGVALKGATVLLHNQIQYTNEKGRFIFKNIAGQEAQLFISSLDFQELILPLIIDKEVDLDIHLVKEENLLQQILIKTTANQEVANSQKVNQTYVRENFQGSLAGSLSNLVGVNAAQIGSNNAKPVIRGLTGARVAVIENATKQQEQQWGSDHGLEIDAFSSEQVQIIKGVGTIEYGSDAIAGVININNEIIPSVHSFAGNALLITKTNNQTYGGAFNIKARDENVFYKIKFTALDYGDYKVPVENITYMGTEIPLYNNIMQNTAGQMYSFWSQIGYVRQNWKSIITLSNVSSKSGLFPGSHGAPGESDISDDGDRRNIGYPNQGVNHLKVISNTTFDFGQNSKLSYSLSFQNNVRKERNEFHTHIDNNESHFTPSDVELQFTLNTIESAIKFEHLSEYNHKTVAAIQVSTQNNLIDGYEFMMPKYNQQTIGLFATHEHMVNDNFTFEVGARVDWARINTSAYFDENLFIYLTENSYTDAQANSYAQRAQKLNKKFSSLNVLGAIKYVGISNVDMSLTFGTNFRFPNAIELASNGMHSGAYRHEKGNASLDPEKGVALDYKIDFTNQSGNTSLSFSPYLYYFTNYIYLRPTGEFSVLPDSGQIYQYEQSRALITGFELTAMHQIDERWSIDSSWEYIYNKQIGQGKSGNYPLPLTPAMNILGKLSYKFNSYQWLEDPTAFVAGKGLFKQKRIAQGEQETPGSFDFSAGFNTKIHWNNTAIDFQISATNIFNARIFNHMSYYRSIGVPEMGRAIQLMIQVPF